MKVLMSVVLFFALSNPCSAMIEITQVSKEFAEELGVQVRSKAAGPGRIWVGVEFKREGRFKYFDPDKYSRVEMHLMDGEKSLAEGGRTVVNAALHIWEPQSGTVGVGFYLARDQVAHVQVLIVVGSGLIPGGGFELELKDFIDLEKLDVVESSKSIQSKHPENPALPATSSR